jgi:hypothetical protein
MEAPLLSKSFYLILILVLAFVMDLATGASAAAQTHLLADPGATLADRLGKVPPPGVHPRILIGPKELTTLRQLVQNSVSGKFLLGRVESFLNSIHGQGKDLTAVYEGLVKGDKNSLAYATSDWWRTKVPFAVAMECYDALLVQDQARGRRAGAALATLASIPRNWTTNSDLVNLALGYDFDYPYMTPEQQTLVRQAIASVTAGKKPFGSDLPPDWRDYNWMPGGTDLLLAALAIEGEKGYDASIYPASLEVMKQFLQYGISQSGSGLEEMHYFHFGMQFGALAMVAFARHGDDLFTDLHYRALPNWLIASMEPFGDAFSTHQDTPNDQGGLAANYVVMKWVWPDDPVIDIVWRNRVRVGYQGLTFYEDWQSALPFPSDPRGWPLYAGKIPQTSWGIDEAAKPPDYPDPVAGIENLKLPLSYWDPQRGLLITRNKWGSDGMVLHFDINAQASGGGSHYHSNSTMFTLSALGRKWGIDRGFHIAETKDNSLILIDGRGQGFFPIGGKTAEYREDTNLTVISGDSSEPYHWMTRNQIATGAAFLAGFHWEPDTRADNVKKYAELATVDKVQPWKDKAIGSRYVFRASYNPVEKAFRTAALRRGAIHSYVLLIDDIKKDGSTHQYDWLMQVPDDLVIKSSPDHGVILGSPDPKDNRRMLVQMIGARSEGNWVLENYEVKRSAETGDTSSFGTGKRLRYSTKTIEPGFKVLMYPYREGAALPNVSANPVLNLHWPDQNDRYQLSPLPSGRTGIHMIPGQ